MTNFFQAFFREVSTTSAPLTSLKQMAATEIAKAFCVLELAKTKSITLVQRHFRRRYGEPPPTRQSIYDWSKNFKKLVVYAKVKVLGDHHEETLERVRETFTRSPRSC